MEPTEGARSFLVSGDAYDDFMGRYSRPLAIEFADAAVVGAGQRALDVGCGPGALTAVLVERLGPANVAAFDPSPSFCAVCSDRFPGVDVRPGRAEEIPFDEDAFDVALAQLVLHFVSEPIVAATELCRVVRPGGRVGACVWDFDAGMQMLRHFWDAATTIDPDAPDEARTMRFGRAGEIADLFEQAGVDDIAETTLGVASEYAGFDELWGGLLHGIGPAGSYCMSLPDDRRERLRDEFFRGLGSPGGAFELAATARCATGRVRS